MRFNHPGAVFLSWGAGVTPHMRLFACLPTNVRTPRGWCADMIPFAVEHFVTATGTDHQISIQMAGLELCMVQRG
jgi:hypothetical protein